MRNLVNIKGTAVLLLAGVIAGCGGADSSSSSSGSMGGSSSSSSSSSSSGVAVTPVTYEKLGSIEVPKTSCSTVTPSPDKLLDEHQFANLVSNTFRPLQIDITNDLKGIEFTDAYSQFHFDTIYDIADAVAKQVAPNVDSMNLSCNGNRDCADKFIRKYVRRSIGRTPTNDEVNTWLNDLYDDAADHTAGIEQLTRFTILHPEASYRFEEGRMVEGRNLLTAYDKANKLALMLWNSVPDDKLLNAADNGELDTRAGLQAQVERMLQDPRMHAALHDIHNHWFHLDTSYSEDPILPASLKEFDLIVQDVFANNGSLKDLFTTDVVFVNKELADTYGLDSAGLNNDEFVKRTVNGRPGLLTRAAFLVGMSESQTQTSPTVRGLAIADSISCLDLENEPPAEFQDLFPTLELVDGKTTRQSLEELMDIAQVCKDCHELMDPYGFALENFDQKGRFRDNENGLAIDASVTDSYFGTFDGPSGLANALTETNFNEVAACYTKLWYKHATALEGSDDDCVLQDLKARIIANKGDLNKLVQDIVDSPAFHYREL